MYQTMWITPNWLNFLIIIFGMKQWNDALISFKDKKAANL